MSDDDEGDLPDLPYSATHLYRSTKERAAVSIDSDGPCSSSSGTPSFSKCIH